MKEEIGISRGRNGLGIVESFGFLFGPFFIMLLGISFVISFLPGLGLSQRTEGLLTASLQSLLVFILPALIYARILSKKPLRFLELTVAPSWSSLIGVVVVFIIGLPFLNQIIFWNESVTFPQALKGMESVFREMEDRALEATEVLLSTTSIGGLITGVLIVGVLTGIAEELFFRGGVQRILVNNGVKSPLAIWITAFIFSFLHFQFFGFIPRLLLGAFFGYLLYWTGSIWVSIFAHSLNNSLVVFTSWLMRRGVLNTDLESIGTIQYGIPWIAILSCVLLILLFNVYRKQFFKKEM